MAVRRPVQGRRDRRRPILLTVLLAALGAAGAVEAGAAEGPRLRILEAVLDTPQPGVVTIRGEGFPTARPMQALVCLGERTTPLEHTVVDAGEIQASLPPALAPGTYRLSVNAVFAFASPRCPPARGTSPTAGSIDLALGDPSWREIQVVICAEAADPRPGVCPAVGNCRCPFAPGVPACTLSETAPGEFLVEKSRNIPASSCRVRPGEPSRCGSSSLRGCSSLQCDLMETCVFNPVEEEDQCQRPCASDADCGPYVLPQDVSYVGVQAAGSRNTVVCNQPVPFPPTLLSNNDALACIGFWESACAP